VCRIGVSRIDRRAGDGGNVLWTNSLCCLTPVLSRGVVAPSASDRGQKLSFSNQERPRQPEGSRDVQIFFWSAPACARGMPGATAGWPSSASFSSPLQQEFSIHGHIKFIEPTYHRYGAYAVHIANPDLSIPQTGTLLDEPAVAPAFLQSQSLFAPWRLGVSRFQFGNITRLGAKQVDDKPTCSRSGERRGRRPDGYRSVSFLNGANFHDRLLLFLICPLLAFTRSLRQTGQR